MKQFVIFKNGYKPTEDEFIQFAQDYLGIVQWSCNFAPLLEFENNKENKVYGLETSLFTEQKLDGYSMDWEFIEATL